MRFSEVYAVYAVYAVYGGLCGLVSPVLFAYSEMYDQILSHLKNPSLHSRKGDTKPHKPP